MVSITKAKYGGPDLNNQFYKISEVQPFYIDLYGDILILPTSRQKENVTIQKHRLLTNFIKSAAVRANLGF